MRHLYFEVVGLYIREVLPKVKAAYESDGHKG